MFPPSTVEEKSSSNLAVQHVADDSSDDEHWTAEDVEEIRRQKVIIPLECYSIHLQNACGHLENFHDTKQLIISLKELCACYFFAVVMDHDFENWPLNRRLLPNTGPPYTGSTLYV